MFAFCFSVSRRKWQPPTSSSSGREVQGKKRYSTVYFIFFFYFLGRRYNVNIVRRDDGRVYFTVILSWNIYTYKYNIVCSYSRTKIAISIYLCQIPCTLYLFCGWLNWGFQCFLLESEIMDVAGDAARFELFHEKYIRIGPATTTMRVLLLLCTAKPRINYTLVRIVYVHIYWTEGRANGFSPFD